MYEGAKHPPLVPNGFDWMLSQRREGEREDTEGTVSRRDDDGARVLPLDGETESP
jgi:hypothetical protein